MKNIFTRNYILLFTAFFTAACAFHLIFLVVPVFAMQKLHLSEVNIGLIVGIFSISALIARPFTGYIADNFSRKAVLIATLAIVTAALASYIFAVAVFMLLAIRMLHGIGWSGVYTSTYTLAADVLSTGKRGEGIGYFSVLMPLAMVLFPAAGLGLFEISGSYRLIFSISAIMTVTAICLVLFIKNPNAVRERKPFSLNLSTFYDKRASGIAVIQIFYSITYSGLITFMPLFALTYGVGKGSRFFMIYAISVLISRFFIVRRTFDMQGPDFLMLTGFLCFFFGTLSMAMASSPSWFYTSAALAGLGGGMVSPTVNAMAMNITEPKNRGKANATVFTANDIGMSTGSIIFGIAIQLTSYRIAYAFTAFTLFLPLLFYFFYERPRYFARINQVKNNANACL